jgi:phage-related protein
MSTLATMVIKLVGDVGGFTQSLDKAKSETRSFSSSIESSLGSLGKIAGGFVIGNIVTAGLSKVADVVGDLKSAMIDGNAEFERYEVQFGVLLGSADAAQKRLKELAEFGAKTPFELPEVVRADKVLQSFGLHAEDTAKRFGASGKEIRTIAGDVAAGTGASFEEIAGYIGKFSAGSTGEAIARFQELGVVTRKELSEMGLRFSKSGELLSPLDESMTVLLESMQGKFGGMMDAQSNTFEGMLSNIKDWIGQAGRVIGKPIFEKLKAGMKGLMEFLSSPRVQAAIESLANGIANFVQLAIDGVGRVVAWFQTNWPAIQAAVQPVLDAIIGGLQAIFGWVTENGPAIQSSIATAWENIRATVEPAVQAIGAFIQSVFGAVATFLSTHGEDIKNFIGETWNTIRSIVEPVIKWFYDTITSIFGGIAKWIGENQGEIQRIFQGVWDGIKIFVGTVLEVIRGIVNAVLSLLRGDVRGALDAIKNMFTNIWNGIKDYVAKAVETVRMILLIIWAKIKEAVENAWNGIKTFIENAWEGIINFFRTLPARLFAIGKEIIEGLWNGIKSMFANIGKGISDFFQNTIDDIRKKLGIQSPSKAFQEIGQNMMRGLALGIAQGAALPQLALDTAGLNAISGAGLRSAAASVSNTANTTYNVTTDRDGVEVLLDRQRRAQTAQFERRM